jgi:hypothetical protein
VGGKEDDMMVWWVGRIVYLTVGYVLMRQQSIERFIAC